LVDIALRVYYVSHKAYYTKEKGKNMKALKHSKVLSQRLAAFYDEGTEYLTVDVKGHPERLVLRAKPNSEFLPAANGETFLRWEQSSYFKYDPERVLAQVKGKIEKITFLEKTYQSWENFLEFICDPDIDNDEKKFRSTVDFPKSVAVAVHLKAEAGGKKMREVLIDALKAYL